MINPFANLAAHWGQAAQNAAANVHPNLQGLQNQYNYQAAQQQQTAGNSGFGQPPPAQWEENIPWDEQEYVAIAQSFWGTSAILHGLGSPYPPKPAFSLARCQRCLFGA
jgi:hypothetical protein